MKIIRSRNNSILKNIVKISHSAKARRDTQSFIVEGVKLVEEAKRHGFILYTVISESRFNSHKELVGEKDIVLSDVNFKDVSDTVNSQGIIAVCGTRKTSQISFDEPIIILDRIQDPGNMGGIMRSAEAFGYKQIACVCGSVDAFNPKVIRASMGAVFRLNILENINYSYIKENIKEKFVLCCADCRASSDLEELSFPKNHCIVIGNEGRGISEELSEMADKKFKIRMTGGAESLNANVAAAITLYVASRP